MKKTRICIALLGLILSYSCHSPITNQSKEGVSNPSVDSIYISSLPVVDIDKYPKKAIKKTTYLELRHFDTVGKTDTLKISHDLISVIKSKSMDNPETAEEFIHVYSTLEIYYKHELLFKQDSVTATGVFEYNEKEHLLSFLIFTGQSDADLSTTSDLYLLNTVLKKCKRLKKSVSNSTNVFFSMTGKSLFYLNDSLLYKYNISDSTEKAVMKIINDNDNRNILLDINILTNSSFNLIFVKNPTLENSDVPDNQTYEIEVNLKSPIFQ